jgi:hypothetical protein
VRAPPNRPGLRELGPLLALALFVVALAFELVAPLSRPRGAPVEAYVEALRAHDAELKSGTRVLVHPPWRTDVLEALPKLPAGVRATVALSAKHGAEPGRILILADKSQPLPRARERQAQLLAKGPVRAYLITTPRPKGVLVLDDHIDQADVVAVEKSGERVECKWSEEASRHLCPGMPEWVWVGPRTVASGGESRRCLWSHPISGGQVITRFAARALPEGELVLRHALKDRVARSGDPVDATIKLDGKRLGKVTRDAKRGFKVHRLKLPSSDEPRSLEVVVETKNAGARHYCFTLSVEPKGTKR